MKKLWLFLVVTFCFISSAYATSIDYKNTGYYFKVNGEVKELKKYFAKNKEHKVLFKKDYQDASFSDYTYTASTFSEANDLATIIYYGYNRDKTIENYYNTQMYIWKKYYNLEVSMCDEEGEEVSNEEEIYTNLQNIIDKHYQEEEFFKNPIKKEIWTTSDFNFYNDLEMTVHQTSLNIQKNNNGITIYNDMVGEYTFEVASNYIPLVSRYYKGNEYFIYSSQGPSRKIGTISYEIYGTPFKVTEEIIGVNGKMGDVKNLYHSYGLYLNGDYKLSVDPEQLDYVKSQEFYVLSGGFNPYLEDFKDLSFYVDNEEEYILNVKRYLKGQKVNLNILDDNTYYIYLKSNDELYYVVNQDIKDVLLPLGEYYLKNKEGDYNISFIVNLRDDVNLEINNPSKKEEVKNSIPKYEPKKEETPEKVKAEEVKENVKNEEVNNKNLQEELVNPQTLDNISIYFLTFFLSLISLGYISHLTLCKDMSNHVNLTK